MTAYIFTGGEVFASCPADIAWERRNEIVIAADSGYLTCRRFGIMPDILLGDLDSLDRSRIPEEEFAALHKRVVSPIKDDTDTQLAVEEAVRRGADNIVIVGGLGGRLDHTLSTVFLCGYLKSKNVGCTITDGRNRVRLLRATGNKVGMTVERGWRYLSLVALTDICRGVNISGVYYPLHDTTLTRDYAWAVSNEITADFAEISLTDGDLLVIESRDR